MLLLQCQGCAATVVVDCACPPELAEAPLHMPGACPLTDLDAALACAPGAGCCADDHGGRSHGQAAAACTRDHTADPCPAPASCPVWAGMTRDYAALDPAIPAHAAVRADLERIYGRPVTGTCPGGHCHQDIDGCAVCRPITITLLPGSAVIRPAPGLNQ